MSETCDGREGLTSGVKKSPVTAAVAIAGTVSSDRRVAPAQGSNPSSGILEIRHASASNQPAR